MAKKITKVFKIMAPGGNLHRIDELVVTASLVERATILALLEPLPDVEDETAHEVCARHALMLRHVMGLRS